MNYQTQYTAHSPLEVQKNEEGKESLNRNPIKAEVWTLVNPIA